MQCSGKSAVAQRRKCNISVKGFKRNLSNNKLYVVCNINMSKRNSLSVISHNKLERCERQFIKRLFYLPDYTSNEIQAIVSGIPSVATITNQKKLYFLGRIITLPKIPDVVKAIMKSRLPDFFDGDNSSPHGFLHDIVCLLEKYEFMAYVLVWKNSSLFPSYREWKSIVNSRLFKMHGSQLQAVSLEVPNVKLVLSAFTSMNSNFTGP